MKRVCVALLAASLLLGCGRKAPPPPPGGKVAESDRAFVSLERVTARRGPSENAPEARTLSRGTEVRITGDENGFFKVSDGADQNLFLPVGSLERLADKEAREKRAAQVVGFTAQPGRAVEDCPIFLAPDFGAARWGKVEDGDDVEVLLADHDFYGIRLSGALAFAPARSIRLLPGELPAPERPEGKGIKNLSIVSLNPGAVSETPVVPVAPEAGGPAVPIAPPPAGVAPGEPAAGAALEALPPGATEPELLVRVEPRYPEMARRMRWEGEVVLKAVVEADGRVDRVTVVAPARPGMSEAAADALKRWIYRPARVDGRPVAVYKVFRIAFKLD